MLYTLEYSEKQNQFHLRNYGETKESPDDEWLDICLCINDLELDFLHSYLKSIKEIDNKYFFSYQEMFRIIEKCRILMNEMIDQGYTFPKS